MELQTQVRELRDKGLGIATISYDPVQSIAAFVKDHGITYTMLSDKGSVTIKKFGLLNPTPDWALGPDKDDPAVQAEVRKYTSVVGVRDFMVGIAFPGTFILDPQGRVKQRFFEDFYIERNTVSNLLIKLGDKTGAAVAATKISTAHLEITTYPSSSGIAPGSDPRADWRLAAKSELRDNLVDGTAVEFRSRDLMERWGVPSVEERQRRSVLPNPRLGPYTGPTRAYQHRAA